MLILTNQMFKTDAAFNKGTTLNLKKRPKSAIKITKDVERPFHQRYGSTPDRVIPRKAVARVLEDPLIHHLTFLKSNFLLVVM